MVAWFREYGYKGVGLEPVRAAEQLGEADRCFAP
jgi:hypothetical protein